MKKKAFLATLTAATLALGCGAFVACGGHTHTYSDKWDSNAEGHWHSATCDDLKAGDKDYTKDYAAHVWGDDNECDVCHYKKTEQGGEHTHSYTEWGKSDTEHWKYCADDNEIDEDTRVPHNYVEGVCECGQEDPNAGGGEVTEEYTITLSVGEGTLPTGATTTYTTVGGKLNVTLPVPTATAAHWLFDDWYDAEEGGNAITEATTEFTEDTTIYARYVRDDGMWNGETFMHALTKNNGASGCKAEYWFGGAKVAVEKDDVLSLYLDGQLMSYFVSGAIGIENPGDSVKVTSVTVTVSGELELYLKHNNDDTWSCQFLGATEVTGINLSEIQELGCAAVHINVGTQGITLYVVTSDGAAVTADDFSNYKLYTYSPEIFTGSWNGSKVFASEITPDTATATLPAGFIIRWASESDGNCDMQTGDIKDVFEDGGVYCVQLPSAHQGQATVKSVIDDVSGN